MDYLITESVLILLCLVAIRNGSDTDRGLTCVAVLWSTIPGYWLYHTDYYFTLVDIFGSYGYQSLTPLLAIFVLSFIRGKLSAILMLLFFVLICANTYFFWLEGQGQQVQSAQQLFVWLIFFIEVALMLSPRLTNGIHGSFQRHDLAGDSAEGKLHPRNFAHSLPSNSSQVEK